MDRRGSRARGVSLSIFTKMLDACCLSVVSFVYVPLIFQLMLLSYKRENAKITGAEMDCKQNQYAVEETTATQM